MTALIFSVHRRTGASVCDPDHPGYSDNIVLPLFFKNIILVSGTIIRINRMRTPGKRFIIHRQVQSEQLPKAASSLLLSMTAIDSQHYASAAKNNLALDSSAVFSTFDGYFQYTATLFIPDPGVVMKFSAIVLILLLMPGCVFYYKTGDMRNSFNDADRKLAEGIGTMETFQTEASDGYAFLMRTVSDTTAIPYPVLAGYLDRKSVV